MIAGLTLALLLLAVLFGAVALQASREKQRADRLDRAAAERLLEIGKLGSQVFAYGRERATLRADLQACQAQRDQLQTALGQLRAEMRQVAGVWSRPDGARLEIHPDGFVGGLGPLRDLPTDGRQH